MKDRLGREYAKLSHLHAGQCVEADEGFDCMDAGQRFTVFESSEGMFVCCRYGRHYLAGQAHDIRDSLIGFYPVEVHQ